MRDENTLLLQKLARMERRVKGDIAMEEKGPGQGGQRKRSRDRGEIGDKLVKKRKGSSVERGGVTVVGEERIDRVAAWAGYDRHRTFNEVETVDYREDELTDEFIGDSEHSLASEQVEKASDMARPDTPASATSEDASVTKVEVKPRLSKRPRKVTETGGRRLGGSKSHSPAVGERQQGGKGRRSKVYQGGKDVN